jgi:hypothetical protein
MILQRLKDEFWIGRRSRYIQTWKAGERRPALSHIHANFFVNTHFGIHSLDHDDGSNNFLDTSNVVAFAGMSQCSFSCSMFRARLMNLCRTNAQTHNHSGMKNFLGFAKQTNGNLFVRPDTVGEKWVRSAGPHPGLPGVAIPLPKGYYFPFCARSLGQKPWRNLSDTFIGNTCVMNSSGTMYIRLLLPPAVSHSGLTLTARIHTILAGVDCGLPYVSFSPENSVDK